MSPENPDDAFEVEKLDPTLKLSATRSGILVVFSQVALAIVGMVNLVLLARLLLPEDFGLVAMVFPFTAVVVGVQSLGLDYALIQREKLDAAVVDKIFWLSCKYNAGLTIGLIGVSPLAVWFFDEPRLLLLNIAYAAGFAALSFGVHHEALLKRKMRFGALTSSLLIATVVGSLMAVFLGWLGMGYWALAAQLIITNMIRSALSWYFCSWRPRRVDRSEAIPSRVVFASVRTYARQLTITRTLTMASTFADRILVGFVGGAVVLGLYETGRKLAYLTLIMVFKPLLDVAVAGFSRTNGNDERYNAYAAKATRSVLALVLPCIVFTFVEADKLTLFLLGSQWLDAIPFVRVLAVGAFAQCFVRILPWFYLSKDRAGRQIAWLSLNLIVSLIGFLAGAWLGGPMGIAVSVSAVAGIMVIPASIYTLKDLPFKVGAFFSAAMYPVVYSHIAGVVLFGLRYVFGESSNVTVDIALSGAVYALIYLLAWTITSNGRIAARQICTLFYKC